MMPCSRQQRFLIAVGSLFLAAGLSVSTAVISWPLVASGTSCREESVSVNETCEDTGAVTSLIQVALRVDPVERPTPRGWQSQWIRSERLGNFSLAGVATHAPKLKVGWTPWILGICLMLAGQTLCIIGLQLQKISHMEQEVLVAQRGPLTNLSDGLLSHLGLKSQQGQGLSPEPSSLYFLRWPWLLGGIVWASGHLMCWSALGLAPEGILAFLQGWTILANLILAPYLLGETVNSRGVFYSLLLVGGCTIVVWYGPRPNAYAMETMGALSPMFLRPAPLVLHLSCFWLLIAAMCLPWVRSALRRTELSVCIAATCAWYAALCIRSAGVLNFTLNSREWQHMAICGWYVFVLAFATFIVGQIHFINMALKHGPASLVIPLYEGIWLTGQIFFGGIVFGKYQDIAENWGAIGLWPGVIMVIVGLVQLCQREIFSARAVALPPASPAISDSQLERERQQKLQQQKEHRTCASVYVALLLGFLTVQFGHGSNIGVAVSLEGNSKAMNLALGSWVTAGVCLGLPLTPWACRTFGAFRVFAACLVIDLAAILLMMWPGITVEKIYLVRFLVGFFEAPILPYLQQWLARYGKHTWNIWNTVLHATIPLGENVGYIVSQELVEMGCNWQYAFAGQATILALCCFMGFVVGGRRYLDVSYEDDPHPVNKGDSDTADERNRSSHIQTEVGPASDSTAAGSGPPPPASNREIANSGDGSSETEKSTGEMEYAASPKWAVFWTTNVAFAAQLGFLNGLRYVVPDYGKAHGFSLQFTLLTFSTISLLGPALGGSVSMSGLVIRPDKWSQHRWTLVYIVCASVGASVIAVFLPYSSEGTFWPALFACFIFSGSVYPAAQGIINTALTAARVIDASAYQVQCGNILVAMPIPYMLGKSMDLWGQDTSFRLVMLLQFLAATGFTCALLTSHCTENENTTPQVKHCTENEKTTPQVR